MPFAVQKLSSFMRFHLSILNLRAWTIGVLFRKFPPVPMSSRLIPTFSSIIIQYICLYVEVLDSLGFELCARWQIWIYFHFSMYRLPVKPAPFIEEDFFPLYIFGFFVKDQVYASVWLYFWFFSSIPLYRICLYTNPILLKAIYRFNAILIKMPT